MKNFIISGEKREFAVGETRMFGSPDAPEYFDWPVTTSRYGDDVDMTFIAQINCKDLESELLPKEGILYFFYNAAEQPATPNVKGAAKVFWFNENEDNLATLRLVDEDGNEIYTAGVEVNVKVPVSAGRMSDDTEAGGTCGNIISLIYKGDHYHFVVRTKNEEDIHLHDEYLWNEDDYVSVIIPKESIELTFRDET